MTLPLPAIGVLLGAVPWKDIGKILLRNWKLILIAALFAWWWMRGNTIEELETQITRLENREKGWDNAVTTLRGSLERNAEAVSECAAINAANAADLAGIESQSNEVEAAAVERNAASENRVRELYEESESLRGLGPVCMVPEYLARRVRRPTATP